MSDPTQTGGQENPRLAAIRQIAKQAQDAVAADMADFDEDTGEVTPRAAEAAASADPEAFSPPASEEQPTASAPKMLTIIVDGQPIEVEESRIIEAGKRTLQKDNAADRRLQEAAQLKRQYEAQLATLRASSDPAQNEAPSQDAPAHQTTVDPAALDAYLESKLYNRDANKAVASFVEEFKEIAEDQNLMAIAVRLEDQRLAMANRLGEPLGDPVIAYRKHGEAIRKWMQEKAGAVLPTGTTSGDKADRKRTITAVPVANARSPSPKEEKPMTVSERIEQARIRRLQGRPVPLRNMKG